jgi:ferredoxin-NADP reductase/ferredoxin
MSVDVRYEGRTVSVAAGATVLEGLEQAGVVVPSSCRAGVCQFCMMRVVEGPVPPRSQDGLKDSLKASGHFLSCVARPEAALTCEPAHVTAFRGPVTIEEICGIGPDIARIRFARPAAFEFSPGQFLTLRRDDGLGRSYSIAAGTADSFDIHVRHVANGRMSGWLHRDARPGDQLWAEGPKGDCMYYPGSPEEPLTLVGTGTGMAPLFAIADDAVRQGHKGPVVIYQGALSESRLYLVDELQALAARGANVRYVRCLLQGTASEGVVIGDLKDIVLADLPKSPAQRAYLCGEPGLVRDLKRRLFLRGISYRKIHADPFVGADD